MKKHADGTPAFDADALGSTGAMLIDPSAGVLAAAAISPASGPGSAGSAASGQIVFIEGSVADYQILADGVQPGVTVVVLNPYADGVQQIADYLQQHHVENLGAISIVADGADGELQLGTTLLSASNVASYQPQLAEIGAALQPGGDLLLYGCDVAQNSTGVAFLGDLAAATGVANIAAASHVVGAAAQGGSFNLDVDLGNAAATGPFTAATMAAYPDLLPVATVPALVWYITDSSTTSNTGVYTIDVSDGASATNPTDVKSTPGYTGFVTVDGLAIDPADGHYFVANYLPSGPFGDTNQIIEGNTSGTGTPSVIYTSGNSGGDAIVGLAFDQVNDLIYMAVTDVSIPGSNTDTGIYTISALGTGTRTATELVNLSAAANAPNDIAIDTTHNLLFYTNGVPGLSSVEDVGVANLTTGAVINADLVSYSASGVEPYGIAVNSATDTLYWTTINDTASSGNAVYSATYTTGASVTLGTITTLATTSQAQTPIGISLDVPAGGYYVDTSNGISNDTTANEILWGGSLTAPDALSSVYSVPLTDGGTETLPTEAIVVETLPTVSTSGTVTYSVGAAAVVVDSGATVPPDADGDNLASATVSIASGAGTGDTLSFTNQNGITGSFSADTLTLSGVATAANYQTALDSVQFSTTSTSTTARLLDWTVSDGVVSSATTTSTVDVLIPPTITGISPDTGVSSTDGITDTGALTIDGTAEAGTTIAVFNGGTQIGSGTTSGTAWSVVLGTALAPGNYTLTAAATLLGVTSSMSSGFAVDVDETAPTVTSDNRVGSSPNNASSDQFTVVFSEAVFGVSASSFTLAETGTIGGSIGSVSGSGTTYTVTVNSVTGDGTLGLNLKAAGSNGIEDTAGNAPAAYTSGQTYSIEHTPPSVSSIDTVGSSPNNASTDQFTVSFSDFLGAVTGVSTSSFTLAETGTAGGTINSVSGSGDSYTVTVTGVTGNGTLGLNLKSSGTGISDAAGNSPTAGFTGQTYTIEHTPPSVTSINTVGSSPNNASSDQFSVTFSDFLGAVTGVSTSSFSLAETGTAGGTISSVSGSGDSYTVTVTGVAGDGTLGLNLKSSGTGISDAAGNSPTAGFTGETYTIEHTPPSVTSIDTVGSSPNNASSDQFSVSFSDFLGAVTGVSTSSFSLAETGTIGGTISSVSGSGDSYTVTVTGVTGDGTLGLNLKSSGTGISDAAGNSPIAGFTGETYTIEHTPPSVTSIDTVQPSSNSGGTEQFTVVFSEPVTGVDTSDFTLADTGSVSGTISSISGSGSSYTVTVTGATGSGTMGLDLKSSGTGITDAAGNAISGGFTGGETYTISPASATPSISAPGTATVGVGEANSIGPITIAESPTTGGETFTAILSDSNGVLSANTGAVGGGGSITPSNGGTTLTISGTLIQVNADLTTLTDNDPTTPSDTLSINVSDSNGGTANAASISITVNGLPTISAPNSATVAQNLATSVTPVIVSETGNTTTSGETFTVVVSDGAGVLAANTGASGGGGTITPSNGNETLMINGTLAQVNADLTTLTDDDASTAADTITVSATDSFGNSVASATLIPVTVTSGSAIFDAHVYTDVNGDGVQDTGDTNLPGVTVNLLDGSGNPTGQSLTTDASGNVSFTGLAPGSYEVGVVPPAGDVVSQATNTFTPNTLSAGQTANAIEGVYAPATFDVHVYDDVNADGVQDTGDTNLSGVTVNLLNGSGAPTGESSTTDANGNASFTGLAPGSYEVAVVTPSGDVVSQASNTQTPNTLSSGGSASATEGVYGPPALEQATLDLTVAEGLSLGNIWSELVANGVDPNPSSLKITAVNTTGTQGYVSLNTGAQSLTYLATGLNPAEPVDAFTYTLTDGSGGTVTGTVDVTVTGPNLPTTVATAPGSTTTATGGGQRLISEGPGQTLVGNSAGGDLFFGGPDTTISALGSGNSIFVAPGNHTIAMGVNNNTATLGNGNNSVSATGTGNTVTAGNGNDAVSGMTGSSTITLGNGNDTVNVSGANNNITVGTGTDHVTAGNGGNETVMAGNGTNTISAGGSGDSITVGNGSNTIAATGADATIVAGNGNDTIVGTGAGDNITVGAGNDTIQVTVGLATIRAGLGTDTIKFAGSSSDIINQGGTDTLTDTGTDNTIVLPLAGQGQDTTNGSVLANGDTFDLRSALAGTTWDQQLSDLGNYLTLGTSGSNTLVQISVTSGGTPITVAILDGQGSVSLSSFVAHALLT
jgi:Domain of unknown function (DUF4347)/SdrD B-like domain/Bacterial Ig-like domain